MVFFKAFLICHLEEKKSELEAQGNLYRALPRVEPRQGRDSLGIRQWVKSPGGGAGEMVQSIKCVLLTTEKGDCFIGSAKGLNFSVG